MRFGLLYEHPLPRPWIVDDERRLIADAVEQIALADRMGFDCAWAVEHHFLEEASHSSAPDVFLAAVSQRTQRIRLGLGTVPLAPAIQHPARVAEAAATLDLVSGGRVELATGEALSGAELEGFGVDRATKRAQWAEALDVVTRMMVEEPFAGWDGGFGAMPPRNVVPKPLQDPHPPLWVACARRETVRLAAEKGVGALSRSCVEPEEAGAWVAEHGAIVASERCVPAGFAVNPRVAVTMPMLVHHDEEEAVARGLEGAQFAAYARDHFHAFGEHRPGRTDLWEEFDRRREQTAFARGAIGTPAQARDLVRRYEAAGVDQLVFVVQAGRARHEHVCEAIELFGEEVLPEFAARAGEAETARAERLGEAIEEALERRAPARRLRRVPAVGPVASGPAEALEDLDAEARGGGLLAGLQARGNAAFGAFVRRAGKRNLERTVGSDAGLRLVFATMAQRFEPEQAGGFTGEIQYLLRPAEGEPKAWVVEVGAEEARARPGRAADPALVVTIGLADFVRMAGITLDPGKALLTGRMELEGDLALMPRLGPMFGSLLA